MFALAYDRSAYFSPCRLYRYSLTIIWDKDLPRLAGLFLNPSTADEVLNDPTVTRFERRARLLNFGSIIVLNMYAYRATNPRKLWTVADPVGIDNDNTIMFELERSDRLLCGWGTNAKKARVDQVLRIIRASKIKAYALGFSQGGAPVHPLYQPYQAKLLPLERGYPDARRY